MSHTIRRLQRSLSDAQDVSCLLFPGLNVIPRRKSALPHLVSELSVSITIISTQGFISSVLRLSSSTSLS